MPQPAPAAEMPQSATPPPAEPPSWLRRNLTRRWSSSASASSAASSPPASTPSPTPRTVLARAGGARTRARARRGPARALVVVACGLLAAAVVSYQVFVAPRGARPRGTAAGDNFAAALRAHLEAPRPKEKTTPTTTAAFFAETTEVVAPEHIPAGIPRRARDLAVAELRDVLASSLRAKADLRARSAAFDPRAEEARARAYLRSKLACGPDVEPRQLARVRIVQDGGVGMSISQALFAINMALAADRIPVFDNQELLWFSNANIGIHDLFQLPCKPPTDVVAQSSVISKASCNDASCDRHQARRGAAIPEPFGHLPLMWWWRQLSRAVVVPTPHLLGKMRAVLREANFSFARPEGAPAPEAGSPFATLFDLERLPRPLIAVHMRRGDSCTGGRPFCISGAAQVLDILAQENVSQGTLLVATDSPALLEDLSLLVASDAREHGTRVFRGQLVSLSIDRSFYEKFYVDGGLRGKAYEDDKTTQKMVHSSNLALEALLDMALLAEGEIHVGSFFSNFIRNAMNLSGRNSRSRYVTFDAQWCPFEICSLGWLTPDRCTRWHRHRCQWRPDYLCNKTSVGHRCNMFAGALCSDQCTIFYQHKDAFRLAWLQPDALRAVSPLLENFVYNTARHDDACCSSECLEATKFRMEQDPLQEPPIDGCQTHESWLRHLQLLHSPESAWPGYSRVQGLTEDLLRVPRDNYPGIIANLRARVAKIVVSAVKTLPAEP